MTLDDFLDIRERKEISAKEVRRILATCGYDSEFIDTNCVDAIAHKGQPNEYHYKKADCEECLAKLDLPQFAYIKFYCKTDLPKRDDGDCSEHIYALVAGKTNSRKQDISFRPPELPDGSRGDKAKWWIKKREATHRWYHEEVLIVWSQPLKCKEPTESRLKELQIEARSLERKIKLLFDLFSS